jgi:hypothetical protein
MRAIFLTVDLANLATGKLFEDGYFTATAEVTTERSERELLVKVFLGADLGKESRSTSPETRPWRIPSFWRRSRSALGGVSRSLTTKRSRLKQIVALQYATLGFVAASIADPETAFEERMGDYRITIPVTEGPRFLVSSIELEGVRPEDESELRSRLSLREGEPFRVQSFAQDRSAAPSIESAGSWTSRWKHPSWNIRNRHTRRAVRGPAGAAGRGGGRRGSRQRDHARERHPAGGQADPRRRAQRLGLEGD